MFPGQCLLAKGPSEMCGMFWVEDLGDLGGCRAYFLRLVTTNTGDPVFREEKGESVEGSVPETKYEDKEGCLKPAPLPAK